MGDDSHLNLTAAIGDRLVARAHEGGFLRHADAVAAIRAVMDGHTPYVDYEEQRPYCRHCYDSDGDSRPWPCATVSAIAKALGVVEDAT